MIKITHNTITTNVRLFIILFKFLNEKGLSTCRSTPLRSNFSLVSNTFQIHLEYVLKFLVSSVFKSCIKIVLFKSIQNTKTNTFFLVQ